MLDRKPRLKKRHHIDWKQWHMASTVLGSGEKLKRQVAGKSQLEKGIPCPVFEIISVRSGYAVYNLVMTLGKHIYLLLNLYIYAYLILQCF